MKRRLTQLLGFEGIQRVEVDERAAGDLFVIAGFPEVEIGDTLADPSDPDPLPRLTVDEPVLSMTFGVNTSPLAGKSSSSKFLTARHLRDRLAREVLGNVSIRIEDTDSPEILQVAGRGELQLAVLIESMRREGFELQVSRPEVITKDVNGKRYEPQERGVCDVPDEHVGTVTQTLAPRRRARAPGRSSGHHRFVRIGSGRGLRQPLRPPHALDRLRRGLQAARQGGRVVGLHGVGVAAHVRAPSGSWGPPWAPAPFPRAG